MPRAEIATLAERWMRFWQGAAGRPANRAGLRAAIVDLYRAFPNFVAVTEFVAIDEIEGIAAIRWSATGRHVAAFLGQPATKRPVRFTGIELIRCRSGAVVERCGEWDEGEILKQIGRAR